MDTTEEITSVWETATETQPAAGDSSGGGTGRRQKNRDAARKSRKKQTQKADELHQELMNLERSNSALEKEIQDLKEKLRHYTTILERHEPSCLLRRRTNTQPLDETVREEPLDSLDPHSLFLKNADAQFSTLQREEFPSLAEGLGAVAFNQHDPLLSEQADGNWVLDTSSSIPDSNETSALSLSEFLEANDWILSGVGDSNVS
ncbi:uncharacterized protein batf2 [Corythoichthys intestinalis]|uniref:uncharacterized protein batf2 n=1 Tax=Corythoichthys intestinalis TaxID=161448 RepID=UPI0025A562FF|nr:uncharacterized protein batf2 [Corythoichthys intestinalis]XP_057710890.1 uncharacterized protein batf2 [Corythoichthys intestinalis]XP_057710891.1 uncharacterized protein batf2 [Corythoichthys intestinalis]